MVPLAPMGDGVQTVDFGDAAAGGAPPAGGFNPLLLLAIGGAVAWAHYKFKGQGVEAEEDGDEEDGDEYDDEDFDDEDDSEPEPRPLPELSVSGLRRSRRKRLGDVTTDSLIDEPAIIAGRGKKGDCYKAVKLLKGRAGLVRTARERGLYAKVARAVSHDCAHADEEVEEAIGEQNELEAEVEEILGGRSSRGVLHEPGMRKSKSGREDRKTTVEHGDARSKGRTRGAGRPGASAVRVRRAGGESYKLRKEKAKTKRGYTWRKETD